MSVAGEAPSLDNFRNPVSIGRRGTLERSPSPKSEKSLQKTGVFQGYMYFGEEAEIPEILRKNCEKVNFPLRF